MSIYCGFRKPDQFHNLENNAQNTIGSNIISIISVIKIKTEAINSVPGVHLYLQRGGVFFNIFTLDSVFRVKLFKIHQNYIETKNVLTL